MCTVARFLLVSLALVLPAVASAEVSPVANSAFDFSAPSVATTPRWLRYATGKRPEDAVASVTKKRSRSRLVTAERWVLQHVRAGGTVRFPMTRHNMQQPTEEPVSRSGLLSMAAPNLSTRVFRLKFRW
jgi:hypothetical protein